MIDQLGGKSKGKMSLGYLAASMMLTRERWQAQRERFAAILRVERQYQELTRAM